MYGVHVADMVAAVGQPGLIDGRRVLVVHGRAATAGAAKLIAEGSEESTVWIDATTGIPRSREDILDDGPENGVSRFAATYYSGHVEHEQRFDDGHTRPWTQTTPAGRAIYDNFSIVGLLRGWHASIGAVANFYAVTDRLLNLHVARYSGIEEIAVLGRRLRVHRYDVDVFEATATEVSARRDDQSYTMWFTDDAGRVPVKIAAPHRIGRMVYELTDYQVD
jgi:hypothetical protein